MADLTATILQTQRLSTEDGPGIRSTVFFKGCPLRCEWCHNPESIHPKPQMQWVGVRCIGCEICLETCPQGAITINEDKSVSINRDLCRGCGECAAACPSNALELLGSQVTVSALANTLLKDRMFYETSGGGVTLSGGEPTMQFKASLALLQELHAEDIHTALDTCGFSQREILAQLLPWCNLVLFDLKVLDSAEHARLTGQNNQRILHNFRWLAAEKRNGRLKAELWVRTPLIPAATATEKNLAALADFLLEYAADTVDRWELCAFNNLCQDKYRRIDRQWNYAAQPLMSAQEIQICKDWVLAQGFPAERLIATGATRLEAG